jgi:hypothetical protein
VSAIALIVIVVVALLLAAMLLAGLRRAAVARAAGGTAGADLDPQPFRSHAEESRSRTDEAA